MAKKSRILSFRENEDYYSLAKKGSLDLSHPWVGLLKKYTKDAKNILDIGCGEGTRLASILSHNQSGTGVDISETAIRLAQKQYPDIKFTQTEENILSFKDNTFDLVYSAFVLEHTSNPEEFLISALRVLKMDGRLILVAPNFGAPNRRSPNSTENVLEKLSIGIKKDLKLLFQNHIEKLNWKSVEPKSNTYTMDSDTTVEPYLLTLKKFLEGKGLRVEEYSSSWSKDTPSIRQLLFRTLDLLGIYPFNFWGPHLIIVGRKVNK